jgi:hypothetical protein
MLLDIYNSAIAFNLDNEFIALLVEEMHNRGMVTEHPYVQIDGSNKSISSELTSAKK